MNIDKNTYYVRIFSSKKNVDLSKYHLLLTSLGFSYHEGYKEHSTCYTKNNLTEKDINELKNNLYKYRYDLVIKYCLQKYARNNSYRDTFFKNNNKMQYKCAYCGKKLKRNDVVVDHILPVQKMMDSSKTRSMARLFGIYETNCVRNLAPSCSKCNKKKSSKTGLWVLRGLIGRHEFGWKMVTLLEYCIVLFGLIVMIFVLNLDKLSALFYRLKF